MAKGKYQEWLEPDGLLKLEAWARNGLTDEQIANNMGIGTRTLYDYKQKYPQITQSLKRGKEVVDIQVENALLKRAMGYTYEEIKIEEFPILDTEKMATKTTRTIKHMAADTTAQIFWLKNRNPVAWRDRHEFEESKVINLIHSIPRPERGDES